MTPLPIIAANDPRLDNPARAVLMDILSGLIPPANYMVRLDVDRNTEKLMLKVLHRKATCCKVFGFKFFRSIQDWDNPECLQRQLIGKTYESILSQLRDAPEFLEFEYAMEGNLQFHTTLEV